MKSIVYTHTGDPSVLKLVERPMPAVDAGEVNDNNHWPTYHRRSLPSGRTPLSLPWLSDMPAGSRAWR
ncbi:hypothetical protein GAN18_18120 [Mycobacterium kubicae]|nr:hypothetical protein GAN18_18120 [Mycobacterium kubicae]